jgi:lipopolysaccharide export system permease protein
MILNRLWERYFIWELLKTFLLFITTFYGLYVLIDYASHSAAFHHNHITPTWGQLALYYASDFTKRMDVLVPFALLIATIRTLCHFNVHNELVALLAGGVSAKRLMAPFIAVGLFFTLMLNINNQFLLPFGLSTVNAIGEEYIKERQKEQQPSAARHFLLQDGSTVLFHDFDETTMRFKSVYWVKSVDEVLRMQELDMKAQPPRGYNVELIKREPGGHLALVASFKTYDLTGLVIDKTKVRKTLAPPEELSLTALWKQIPEASAENSEKESQLITAFYKKLAMPWLCLLAVIGPAPFCLRFTRNLQVFFIYAFSIAALVTLYLIIDAGAVLAKRQILAPALAIWAPLTAAGGFIGYRFSRPVFG